MIYPSILDRKYQEYQPFVEEVAKRVKLTLMNFCETKEYAFISRIKTVESLAEKIETGRFKQWSDINDLFACTIIIKNLSHENEAIEFCKRTFEIIKITKRGQNKKSPDSFIFDSTRIDAKLKQPPDFEIESGNYLSIYDIIFEIQIKSAFEHAWSVATHDLVYKSNEIDWRRFRLAAQLKATVEQLDTLILAFEETSKLINVLDYYLQGYTPEQILEHFPTLNLEKIYATLTYYYHNKAETDDYLTRIKQWKETHYQEALLNPSPMGQKIKTIIKERKSVKS